MTDKFPPREGDLTLNELCQAVYPVIARGHEVRIKWTCPDCGDRVASDQPLSITARGQVIVAPGYLHTERDNGERCSRLVRIHEHKFGFMAIMKMGGPQA